MKSPTLTEALQGVLALATAALLATPVLDLQQRWLGERAFRKDTDATSTQVTSLSGLLGFRRTYRGDVPAGWHPLRHRLEACGQAPDDILEVAIESGSGRWPWRVDVRTSTPGAEGCLASVLSTAPLSPDHPPARQFLWARLRLLELDVVTVMTPEPFASTCTAIKPMEGARPYRASMPVPPDTATALVCPHASPLVRATLTYEDDRLVDVATEPSAPCVETAVRDHFTRLPEAWRVFDGEILQRICTFDLPMTTP